MPKELYRKKSGSSGMTEKQGQLRTSGRKITSTPGAMGSTGIYDHHPSPGLAAYPASVGPNDIHTKFAETGVGDANTQVNQLRQSKGVSRKGKASPISSSNMMKKKNPYRTQGKTKQ
jgi:hypothetical protein